MRILVVEDDVRLAWQIASALTEAGHDPIVVHDGEGALDKTFSRTLSHRFRRRSYIRHKYV
jgi:DNA-binding response OmpR family regulator